MLSILHSVCWERARELPSLVEEDLSAIADYLRGLTPDGSLPHAEELFSDSPSYILACPACGNILDNGICAECERGERSEVQS